MISNLTSTTPAIHSDGTISAAVKEVRPLTTAGALLRLWLPLAYDAGGGIGQFMLARCADDNLDARANDWSIYTRRALLHRPADGHARASWINLGAISSRG